jgi:hypothetical protein
LDFVATQCSSATTKKIDRIEIVVDTYSSALPACIGNRPRMTMTLAVTLVKKEGEIFGFSSVRLSILFPFGFEYRKD